MPRLTRPKTPQAEQPAPAPELPPHDEEAERGLLGCLLSPGGLAQLPQLINFGATSAWFFNTLNRAVFSALRSVLKAGVTDEGELLLRVPDLMREADTGFGRNGAASEFLLDLAKAGTSASGWIYFAEQLKSVYRRREIYGLAGRLSLLARNPTEDPAALLDAARIGLESAENDFGDQSAGGWAALESSGLAISRRELAPVVQVVEGILVEQTKLVIGSSSKSYKTWITLDMALSISEGLTWWGRQCMRLPVLYVNLELREEAFDRRVQIIQAVKRIENPDPKAFLHLPLRGRLAGLVPAEIVSRLVSRAQATNRRVIFLDPIYKLNTTGEENDARAMTEFFNQLDRLTTEAGCTVVMNDHFSKGLQSDKDPLDALRGSSAKGGDLDAAIILRKHEELDCYTADVIHRELPPVAPFVVGWEFPLMVAKSELDPEKMKRPRPPGSAKPGRKSLDARKFLAALEDQAEGLSLRAWAKACQVSDATIRRHTADLRKHGWIQSLGDGDNCRQILTPDGTQALEDWRSNAEE